MLPTRPFPPPVGLQLSATLLPTPSTTPDSLTSDTDGSPSSAAAHPYDANIMHRAVPPTLFTSEVLIDATAVDLAMTFSLPVAHIATHWITSRTSIHLTDYSSYNLPQNSTTRTRPVQISSADMNAYRELACALRSKLSVYLPSRAPRSLSDENVCEDISWKRRCGFDRLGTHAQLQQPDGFTVRKGATGLYRLAHCAGRMMRGGSTYVEFAIENGSYGGGMGIGVSCSTLPLHSLVGVEMGSLGFHAAGRLIDEGEWRDYGCAFGPGDVVGMRVDIAQMRYGESEVSSTRASSRSPSVSPEDTLRRSRAKMMNGNDTYVTFFVNGISQGSVALSPMFVNGCRAGVSLYTADSCVTMRCCVSDWELFSTAGASGSRGRLQAMCAARRPRAVHSEMPVLGAVVRKCPEENCSSVLTPDGVNVTT